jgi:succinate dehydrogenase / fumarate reductase cytochrome b subunit
VTDKRPVNLDIGTIKLPITAYVSILHRASGVALIGAIAILLGLLSYSLKSAEDFAAVQACLSSVPMKLLMWAVLAAFIYHLLAGIKHLVMDMGIGETLEGGKTGAVLVLVFTVIGVALAGVWVW